jgi:hypothetical protein
MATNTIGKTIKIENKKAYLNILKTINNQFKSGLFTDRVKTSQSLIKELSGKTNEIKMSTALELRRFIDKMRNTSAFKLDSRLTPKQEEYKMAADILRKKLADAGLKDLMNEERIYIQIFDNIVDYAVAKDNKKLLGLTDILLGGGGIAAGATGAGVGIAAGVRAFQTPTTLTGLGQGINKFGKKLTPVGGGIKTYGAKTIQSLIQSQNK